MVVKVENTSNSSASAISPISRTWEEMALLWWETWEIHLSPESINGNCLIPIVVQQNIAHRGDSLLILVWLRWVHVMERTWISRISIGTGKIDASDHGDVQTTSQVISELI
jgi:hypothetical protein